MYSKKGTILSDIESNIDILVKICYGNLENIESILKDKSLEYFILYKIKKLKLELEEIYLYIYIGFIDILRREISMDKKYNLENMENLLRELNNIKVTMLTNSHSTLNESIENLKRASQIKEEVYKILELAEEEIERATNINNKVEKSSNIIDINNVEEIENIDMLIVNKENIKNDVTHEDLPKYENNYCNNVLKSSSFLYSNEDDI